MLDPSPIKLGTFCNRGSSEANLELLCLQSLWYNAFKWDEMNLVRCCSVSWNTSYSTNCVKIQNKSIITVTEFLWITQQEYVPGFPMSALGFLSVLVPVFHEELCKLPINQMQYLSSCLLISTVSTCMHVLDNVQFIIGNTS